MNKNIAVLAPNGWGVKNFLYNDFLKILSQSNSVYYFTPAARKKSFVEKYQRENIYFIDLKIPKLNSIKNHFFDILCYSQYFRTPNFLNQTYLYKYPQRSKKAYLIKRFKIFLAKYFFKNISFGLQEKIERKIFGFENYINEIKEIFKERKIDLVFSTVPLIAHYEHPALFAAKDLNLKTACIVTSWDNLESKGRFPIKFDHYFCWNSWMKEELKKYYPFIKEEQITISGPPQFDYYYKKDFILDKKEFFNKLDADINKKLILWAGVAPNIFPNEDIVFKDFYKLFKSSELFKISQVVLRPHPIGGLKRFENILKDHSEIICMETNADDPKYLLNWVPEEEDIKMLASALYHSDIIINNCSTISLDAFVFNKPVINIAFDSENGSKMEKYIQDSYKFEYYAPLVNLNAVKLVKSQSELIEAINHFLENPFDGGESRKGALLMQIEFDDGRASERIAKKILELL